MVFLITFVAAFILCGGMVLLLAWSKKGPAYRMSHEDALRLIEWVLLGQATEEEWQLFCHLPIRHDEALDELRLACLALDDEYGLQSPKVSYVLSLEGRLKLEVIYKRYKSVERE